eukprot:gene12688-16134_t
MDKPAFFAAVAEILEVDPAGLTGAELINEVGNWDSLSVISFVAMVDSDMDQIVDGEKLKDAKTLNDLAALRFLERAKADARNPAYDLLPVLNLDQRNQFSKTLAAFSPKTPGFQASDRAKALHAELARDGLTSLQAPLPPQILTDIIDYFKMTPCHDLYRAHLGTFAWDKPASDETNIGYYSWEE